MNLRCELEYHSVNHHLAQLYTGFALLAKTGLITLDQRFRARPPARNPGEKSWVALRVTVNGDLRVFYDVHDSDRIRASDLDECDVYFKRSLRPSRIPPPSSLAERVRPLGLYYPVQPDTMDLRTAERVLRCLGFRRGWPHFLAFLPILDTIRYVPRLRYFQAEPPVSREARAIFLTRAWDPHDRPGRGLEEAEKIHLLNHTRAACIRALKEEFADRVLAGFSHNPFAVRHYPRELATDPSITRKGNYIRHLRSFSIGVATTGLNGSVGAKMGEYVAMGRAIVAERNDILLRGNFRPGTHYLPFDSPEACVEEVAKLLRRPELIETMALENRRYYQSELRPDVLIWRTLSEAMALGGSPSPAQ
ncbi:MAG: glycosyltransferase [Longimicrobiales bacterium]|nr:glycosyltransferase [Longimicrobiales bacterium]